MEFERIESITERIARQYTIKDNEERKCPLCKDDRWIAVHRETGEKMPMTDTVGRRDKDDFYLAPCTCTAEKDKAETLKRSGISKEEYESKTFATFKTFDDNSKNMKEVALAFLEDKEALGCGFYGNSGAGKTHICIAICNELANRGIGHRYFEYRKVIQELVSYQKYNQDEYTRQVNMYKNCSVLYIDDLFKFAFRDNGSINTAEFGIMFDILNHRSLNRKKIIISSEYNSAQLNEFDGAVGSRIIGMTKDYACGVKGKNVRIHKIKD